nr:WD40 repeat domain-containing protein [Gordonia araii]
MLAAGIAIAGNVALGHQRDDARFAELLATAEQTRSTDPGLAAQLSVAAWRLRPDDSDARFGVLRTQDLPLPRSSERLHRGPIYDLVVARTRGLIATASYDRTVRLWAGPRLRPYPTPVIVGDFATSVAFSPDGNSLAVASGNGAIAVFDVTDPSRPALLHRLAVPPSAGTAYILAFSPDGRVLATSHDNGTVALWDADRGFVARGTVDGDSGPVRSLAFGPTGSLLAAVTSGGAVLVVDVGDTASPRVVATMRDGVGIGWHSVAVSPDGRVLAAGRDNGTIGVWGLTDPRAPRFVGFTMNAHPDAIWSLDFTADGQTLVTGGLDGAARRWAVADVVDPAVQRQPLQQIGSEMRSGGGGIMAVDFLADGTLLTAGGARTISAWNLPDSPVPGHRSPIRRPATDAMGTVVVTAGSLRIAVWRIDGDRPRFASTIALPGAKAASDVAVSPDGRLFAAALEGGGTVVVYDISDRAAPRLVSTLPTGTRHVGLVEFAPRGSMLVTADTDSSLRLWSLGDPSSPRPLGRLSGVDGFVESAAFSPDNSTIVVGSADHRTYRWSIGDPARPTGPSVDTVHQGMVLGAVFSADGRFVYTGSDDSTIVVQRVDGSSSTVVRRIPRPSRVTSLSRSADGRWLAAGTDRGTELWSLDDPSDPRHEGTGFGGKSDALLLRTVAFAGSSRVFVGGHQMLAWWQIDHEAQARRVCAATGGTLTEEQWRTAAHNLPFREPCPES